MSVARILIWNLADSKTTLAELREQLPVLDEGDYWIDDPGQDVSIWIPRHAGKSVILALTRATRF